MTSAFILLSFLLFVRAQIDYVTDYKVPAGITVTLSSNYFEDYKSDLMAVFQQMIMKAQVPDKCPEITVGLLDVTLCTKNQELKSIEFFEDLTEIKIDNQGFIKLKMVGKKAVYKMDFSIKSDPEWISDAGTGTIIVQNFTSELKLFPLNVKGKMQFNFSDAHMDVESFNAQFNGQTEIIQSVQLVI